MRMCYLLMEFTVQRDSGDARLGQVVNKPVYSRGLAKLDLIKAFLVRTLLQKTMHFFDFRALSTATNSPK